MKKVICLLLLCLSPFILLAHENNGQETFLTTNEAYEYFQKYIENDKDKFVEIKRLNSLAQNKELFILTFIDEKDYFWIYQARIHENVIIYYQFFSKTYSKKFNEYGVFPYIDTILFKQINKFRYHLSSIFIYDFNHDGNDKLLVFSVSGMGVFYSILSFDFIKNVRSHILEINVPFPSEIPAFEFINYKVRQGIKIYIYNYNDGTNIWAFYYYDRVQQKYVRDETASSEELEQIHGSPDFFAEAGIDYTKLERPLIPADLEGFSKPALRIWRNAVYARHGRTFKSEDLQALFNEYAWYKADKNYTDAKLTDTDKANIKLISEFEKK